MKNGQAGTDQNFSPAQSEILALPVEPTESVTLDYLVGTRLYSTTIA